MYLYTLLPPSNKTDGLVLILSLGMKKSKLMSLETQSVSKGGDVKDYPFSPSKTFQRIHYYGTSLKIKILKKFSDG